MTYIVRDTTEQDVEDLAFTLRPDDRNEVIACGLDPYHAIEFSFRHSSECKTVEVDGRVACIFGVRNLSIIGNVGCPWLLTSPEIEKHPVSFVKVSRQVVGSWLEKFDSLENFVDSRYRKAIRWADSVGFTVHAPQPFGPYGLPFHRISIRRETWEQ